MKHHNASVLGSIRHAADTDKSIQMLNESAGLPIAIDLDFQYQTATVQLALGERVLIFSDGIVEQLNDEVQPDGQRREFGKNGVREAVEGGQGDDLLKQLFQTLNAFAGGQGYTDDVTGVLVQWPEAT